MPGTRRQKEGSAFRQEKFVSHPDLQTAINGLLVAKRCAVLDDPLLRSLIWFVQHQSLKPRGLLKLASELLPAMPQAAVIEDLVRMCLDPDWKQNAGSSPIVFSGNQVGIDPDWTEDVFGQGILEKLHAYRGGITSTLPEKIAATEVATSIWETLDFCIARRRLVRIEGISGMGKSITAKAWCEAQFGMARYVEVPSSNDDRSFYISIANALGVARGSAFNAQEIKLKVEETLRISNLMLILDESQFLIPQYIRPRGIPSRLQWLKTMLDAQVPMALIALPDFTKWQAHYVKVTMWSDEQLERRTNRKILLPAELSDVDLLAIASTLYPLGSDRSWLLLAGYARASVKRNASAISELLESAAYLAQLDGRKEVGFADIEKALEESHLPGDGLPSLRQKSASIAKIAGTGATSSRRVRVTSATPTRFELTLPM